MGLLFIYSFSKYLSRAYYVQGTWKIVRVKIFLMQEGCQERLGFQDHRETLPLWFGLVLHVDPGLSRAALLVHQAFLLSALLHLFRLKVG